jgi:hypothetical protein
MMMTNIWPTFKGLNVCMASANPNGFLSWFFYKQFPSHQPRDGPTMLGQKADYISDYKVSTGLVGVPG